MANLTSTLTVRLLNQVSGPAAAATRSILGIGSAVAAANARGGIAAIGADMAAMATNIDKAANRMRAAAASMSGLSFPLLFAGGFAAKAVYEFERVGNRVEAVTNITKAQRDQLQSYAQSLNSLFPFSNTQIMQSALELGRAGFNFDQIMGALRSTLNLALAGNIELKESSDIATNVLTAMRLPMKTPEQVAASLVRVNDVLSFAANQSNIDVRQLGETFKYVGPIAAAAGISVEQIAAAAMVMGNNGIRASEAGVAMRSAIVRMVKPTRDMQAVLARANIDIRDFVNGGRQISAQDIIKSLATDGIDAKPFVTQIESALKDPKFARNLPGLTQRLVEIVGGAGGAMDKSKLAETIGDALTAAGSEVDLLGFVKALQDKGIDLSEISRVFDTRQGGRLITLLAGFKDLGTFLRRLETEARGSTDRTARIMQQGVVGAWTQFTAAIENMVQAIARSGVLDSATRALHRFASGLEAVAKFNPQLLEFGTYALMIGAAAGPLLYAGANLLKLIGIITAGAAIATGGGVATGAGAAAVAGAGAGAAAGTAAASRRWLSRIPGLGLAYIGADMGWRAIGGHGAVNRYFSPDRDADDDELLRGIMDRISPRIGSGDTPHLGGLSDGPTIPAMPGEASRSAAETGAAYVSGLQGEMERALEMARRYAAEIQGVLNFTASPRINLQINGGDLRGIHADVGVDVTR